MRLVIFDIDGTLTETTDVDAECYVHALADVFGFAEVDTDWSHYPHVTDPGGLQELFRLRKGRAPEGGEVAAFQQRFITLLAAASVKQPFRAVPGAVALLKRLAANPSYCVALGTGSWREAARLKLASAGIPFDRYPAATGDDAVARKEILKLSIQRARQHAGDGGFASMVYVGDGVWDAQACRALGLPFIGIGSGDKAEKLRAEGAAWVCADFSNGDLFVEKLAAIRSPAPGTTGS